MKVFAPVVLDAIADCLRTVYWFQEDLKSFLTRAGVPTNLVGSLPWGQRGVYKRGIVKQLVDRLASNPSQGMPILDKIIDSLVEMNEDLPHLARLEEGKKKVKEGRQALQSLKRLIGRQSVAERAERAQQEKRTEAERVRQQIVERHESLRNLNSRFLALCSMDDSPTAKQKRGIDFQILLRDLFAIYDLDPRGSFARPGEQIDGSITWDGTFVLVESKWETPVVEPKDVRDFQGKVQTKLDNTLGLMISMSGFSENAIREAERAGRITVVLMDGVDIAQVFQGILDLTELLRRKFRHAADYGSAMYHVGS